MSFELVKAFSYSDIPDLIKGKTINEQLSILRDFFGIVSIKKNMGFEGVPDSSIDGLYEVTDGNGKVGAFLSGVGMIKLQRDKFFVDKINAAKNDFKLSNTYNPNLFHRSIDYIVSFDNNNICGLLRFTGEASFHVIPKVGVLSDFDFTSEDELASAMIIFYQQRNGAILVSDSLN